MAKKAIVSIVDDDNSVREAIAALAKSLGFIAATFVSAEEFLVSDYVKTTSCLISDVQMPGLSGIQLQDLLRRSGHFIPIIFVTAFPDEKTRTHTLEAGAIGYLPKPFSDGALIECIDRALNGCAAG